MVRESDWRIRRRPVEGACPTIFILAGSILRKAVTLVIKLIPFELSEKKVL